MLLLAFACAPDVAITPAAVGAVHIDPVPLVLERGPDECTPQWLTLTGDDALVGWAWIPGSGDPDAVALPAVERFDIDGSLRLTLDFCPIDDAPISGALWLGFLAADPAVVPVEE